MTQNKSMADIRAARQRDRDRIGQALTRPEARRCNFDSIRRLWEWPEINPAATRVRPDKSLTRAQREKVERDDRKHDMHLVYEQLNETFIVPDLERPEDWIEGSKRNRRTMTQAEKNARKDKIRMAHPEDPRPEWQVIWEDADRTGMPAPVEAKINSIRKAYPGKATELWKLFLEYERSMNPSAPALQSQIADLLGEPAIGAKPAEAESKPVAPKVQLDTSRITGIDLDFDDL